MSYRVLLQDHQTGAWIHCQERYAHDAEAKGHAQRMFLAWHPFVRGFRVLPSKRSPTHTWFGRFRRIR